MRKRPSSAAARLAAGVCLLLALALPLRLSAQSGAVKQADEKINSSRSQLQQLEKEIQAGHAKAQGLEKQEQSVLRQIRDIERGIDRSQRTLASLNGEISELNNEISFLSRQLDKCGRQLAQKKAILNRRLRGIYKRGRLHSLAVIFGSHSFTDLLRRFKYLTLIAAQDKRLVREVSGLRQSYSQYKLAGERKLALRLTRREELERERHQLESQENERQKLLKNVKAQRVEVLKSLEERKAEAERIREMIADWERKRREAAEAARRQGKVLPPEVAHLSGRKGSLNWPVARGTLLRGFGPYTDQITRTRVINNGIDIQANEGESVKCVGGGAVMRVEWYRSYGKMVMVDHGGGVYSLYTHLSDVFVTEGAQVTEGQVIAKVGSTGSLEGPLLHFEIREGARAVDPRAWLKRSM